jgi:DNA-binding HxlR family transcriptional regulator
MLQEAGAPIPYHRPVNEAGSTVAGPTRSALDEALSRIGDRWTLLVVEALLAGERRFGELERDVPGLAPNILSDRLRRLEREGLIVASPYTERPVRMSYRLTADGQELAGALRLLGEWGARRTGQEEAPHHAACGTAVVARWYCPTCARVVSEDETGELRHV